MRNKYTLSEFLHTIYSLIITKIFYKKARLIRRPFYIRGKASMQIKKGFTTGRGCRFDLLGDKKTLYIGENCKIGDCVHIVAHDKVEIGDNCLMASKIFISDTSHGDYSMTSINSSPDIEPDNRPLCTSPVKIGNNIWIGENVCILLGVNIGDGCIIGANSVVTKNIPRNSMAVGCPAKVIKIFNEKLGLWEISK